MPLLGIIVESWRNNILIWSLQLPTPLCWELLIPGDCNEYRRWRSRSHSGVPCRGTWRKYSGCTLNSSCQLEHDELSSPLVLPEIQTYISSALNESTQLFGVCGTSFQHHCFSGNEWECFPGNVPTSFNLMKYWIDLWRIPRTQRTLYILSICLMAKLSKLCM